MGKFNDHMTMLWRNGRKNMEDIATPGEHSALAAAFAEEHAVLILLSLKHDPETLGATVGPLVSEYFSSITVDVAASRRARHALGDLFLAEARRLACMHAERWFDDANNAVREHNAK